MTDYHRIAGAALAASESVINRWLPGGKRQGHEYIACNPRRTDNTPGSFSINLDGGAWADFATGDKGGDLVSLVAYLDGTNQGPAADNLARFLGLSVNGHDHGAAARPADKPISASTWKAILPVPGEATAPPDSHPVLGKPSMTWIYRDSEGRTLCLVLRFETPEDKVFRPLTFCEGPSGARAWRWQGPTDPRPLYGLDRLAAHPAANVIVCEGEKAADAAAVLLPAPEFITVASLNGAQSPGKSDWTPLAGRDVFIWPDADGPGADYATKVRRLALDAGAAAVSILDPTALRADLPAGWDAADAVTEGINPEAVRAWLVGPEPEADPPIQEAEPKAGYRLIEFQKRHRNGIYFDAADGEPPMLICSPLKVTARTRDGRGGNWGYLLEWKDPDGHPHQWAMPAELLSGDGTEYRSILLDGGLFIAPGSKARGHLTTYIQSARTEDRALCTDRTGWHGSVFVLPDHVIGKPQGNEKVIYQSPSGSPNYYTASGTLDDWQRQVAALAVGNTRVTFAIAAAFASTLLDVSGDENGGFHLIGASSEGKSSALYAAASVFGGRDYLHRWRATSNGLEAIATAHSGALLILDEIGQVDPREAGEIAYMLANGTGKHRADRTGGARRSQSWRLLFLSSGEIDLSMHMASIGRRAMAGQEARLLSFAANPGAGLGIYEDLRGFADGAALSRALDERTKRLHGTAGPGFIEAVARDLNRLPDFLRDLTRTFLNAHLPAGASGQAHRAAERFALVAAGGELATRYGITGWPSGLAGQAAKACFLAWLDGRGGSGDRETTTILSQVRRFFESHGEARFHNWDVPDERPIINRAGVRRKDGETWTYFVLPETFRQEVCAGYDPKAVVKVLDTAGLLVRDKSEGKPAAQHRLPGIGKIRCYEIRPFGEPDT